MIEPPFTLRSSSRNHIHMADNVPSFKKNVQGFLEVVLIVTVDRLCVEEVFLVLVELFFVVVDFPEAA